MTYDEIRARLLAEAAPYRIEGPQSNGVSIWCAKHGVNKSAASRFLHHKLGPGSDLLEALGLEWRIVPKR